MSLSNRIGWVCLLLALSIEAAAGEPEGPFVAVNLGLFQPSGLESSYTVVDADDDFEPEGLIAGPEFSNEFSPEIHFGYAFAGERGIAASYWSFDERATDARRSPEDGSLWDSLFAPDFSLGAFEGTASGDLTLEAERLDLVYYWRIATNDRVELDWKAGIRHARFERGLSVVYDDESDPERVVQQSEADGIGVLSAVESRIRLGKRWSLFGGASLAFLAGEIESSNLNTLVSLPDDTILDLEREEDRTFSTIDLKCGVAWHAREGFDIALGYEFETWNGVLSREFLADDVNPGFLQSDSGDVSWNGMTVGLGISF